MVSKSETAGAFEAGKAKAHHHRQGEIHLWAGQIAFGNFQTANVSPIVHYFLDKVKNELLNNYVLLNAL